MNKLTTFMAILAALSLAGCTVRVEMPQEAQLALRMQAEQVQFYETLADFYDQLGFAAFNQARLLEAQGKLAESQAMARRAKDYVALRLKVEVILDRLRREYNLPQRNIAPDAVSIPLGSMIDVTNR